MDSVTPGVDVERRRKPRIFYGWLIVGGCFSLQMLVGSLMIHSFTAYFPLLQTQFGWSRSVLSGAFALSRAESGLLGPLQGWLIDKFGPRVMVRGGMLLFGLGFIMFSTLDSVLDYYVAFLLMALGSSVGGFLTVATTVVNWFERRRGVAMGIAMSGFGIGGLLVPAIAWSLTELGWRQTAFISGVVIILLGIPLGQLFRQRPEQYGLLPDGDAPDEAGAAATQANETRDRTAPAADQVDGFTAAEAMRTPAFWLLSLGHSLALLTVGAVSLHLVPHIQESVGLSLTAASGAVAVMTVFNIFGQIGGGFLGDRFSKRMLAALAMLVHSVAMLTLAFASSVPMLYAFAVMHGTAWGVRGPMMTTIRADYFGRAAFATIMGFSSLVVMLGMTSGPLFAGILADMFDGYRVPFVVIAALTGIGSLFFAIAAPPRPPARMRR